VIDPEMGKGQMLDGELCVIALPKRQNHLWPGGYLASIDGSHDGAPTKNDRKRTKPPKAGVLALQLALLPDARVPVNW
jgi:hypothetical protein